MKYLLAIFFRFSEDFLNLFRVMQMRMRKNYEIDLQEYFIKIEKDIDSAFQAIKKEYERE